MLVRHPERQSRRKTGGPVTGSWLKTHRVNGGALLLADQPPSYAPCVPEGTSGEGPAPCASGRLHRAFGALQVSPLQPAPRLRTRGLPAAAGLSGGGADAQQQGQDHQPHQPRDRTPVAVAACSARCGPGAPFRPECRPSGRHPRHAPPCDLLIRDAVPAGTAAAAPWLQREARASRFRAGRRGASRPATAAPAASTPSAVPGCFRAAV